MTESSTFSDAFKLLRREGEKNADLQSNHQRAEMKVKVDGVAIQRMHNSE